MTWFIAFAVFVFGVYFWRQYRTRQLELASPTADHRLGLRHIGDVFVLEQPLQNGTSQARIGNRQWMIRGPSLPAGTKVRVTGVDGTVLLVDRVPG